jgi:tRNA nucleotidyltransferase/poly(A) polymerase
MDFAREIITTLVNARIVGGYVRDSLIGKPCHDIDLATPLKPEEVTKLLESSGIKVTPTGIKHGTVTAISPQKEAIEITTLRNDIACDGRYADVEFTDNWEEDAARRDFTINAMSMDIGGAIYD